MDFKLIVLLLSIASTAIAVVEKKDPFKDPAIPVTVTGRIDPPAPPSTSTTSPPPPSTTTTTTTPTPETTTTPAPSTTTPAPKTTTSTTTPAPNTTTPAPTTTTPAPKTTSTPAPTTTTAAPNTTTVAPTTSTAAPNTTTPVPTPTPTPTPKPLPPQWEVVDVKNNNTCVIVRSDISVNVTYENSKNETKELVLVPIVNNSNGTRVEGLCGNETQSISIPLTTGFLTINFNLSSSKSSVSSVLLNVTGLPDLKANASTVYMESVPMFVTPVTMSYKCSKAQPFNVTNADNDTATVIISDTQIQSFRNDTTANFSNAQDCSSMDTPDLVPIAVGVSLGIMIVVVLVAYLIGRHRSGQRLPFFPQGSGSGYVSM